MREETITGDFRSESERQLILSNGVPRLPNGWRVRRFRFLFSESKERNGARPVSEMLSVSEYFGVTPKSYDHDEQKRTEDELTTYKVVRPNQLAVNSMWLNHLGLGVSLHVGHVSPAYNVYSISAELFPRFVHHLLRSSFYLKIYKRYLYGIRPNSFQIKSNDWASIPIIMPEMKDQREIADFLDRETARIDKLVERKQQLIACFEEQIRSFVSSKIGLTKPDGGLRLRFVLSMNPSKSHAGLTHDNIISFVPMDDICDGIGGLELSQSKSFGELAAGSYNFFKPVTFCWPRSHRASKMAKER